MTQFNGRRSEIAAVILRESGWDYKVFAFKKYYPKKINIKVLHLRFKVGGEKAGVLWRKNIGFCLYIPSFLPLLKKI
jgi:hypothetical protein